MSALDNSDNKSVLLRFVNVVIGRIGRVREAINQHLKILVRDGCHRFLE